MMYEAACLRDCSVSRFPRVIIFSATGRAALARVKVVVMRPCSNRLVTRARKVARRWDGLRPSFDPDLRCRMVYGGLGLRLQAEIFLRRSERGLAGERRPDNAAVLIELHP